MATPSVTSAPVRLPSALIGGIGRFARALGSPVVSVIFALVVGAIIVEFTGGDPIQAYNALLCGGFGLLCDSGSYPAKQISETIVFTTPLILTGLSVAIAFRAGLFNIGAEGQLIAGAIASTVVGIQLTSAPGWILLPLVLIAGTLGGMIWGGIVGVLKAITGAHEVVTTIMLNYVAQSLVLYLIEGNGPLQLPGHSASSPTIGQGGWLPTLIPQDGTFLGLPGSVYRAHAGIFIGLAVAGFFAFLLSRTSLGYEIRAVGQSQKAARYAGISIQRTIIVTMLISGAFAGLAGAVQVAGIRHNLTDLYKADTTGFDAIAVALLGQGAAIGVVLSAVLFGGLHASGQFVQDHANISANLVDVLQALILFGIAANFLRTVRLRLPTLRPAGDRKTQSTSPDEVPGGPPPIEPADVAAGMGDTART